MISLDVTAEPRRNLMRPDTLFIHGGTRNVFGLSQHFSISTRGLAKATTWMPTEPSRPFEALTSDALREVQRQIALKNLQKYPQSAHVLNATGQTLLSIGDIQTAVGLFQQALNQDPTHRVAKSNLARAHMLRRELNEAERLYRELLHASGTDSHAIKNLAQILMITGRLAEAEELLSDAIRLNPEDAGAYNERALARLGRQRVNDAIHDLRSSLRIDVHFAAAHNNLGVCHLVAGSVDRALRSFRTALTLDRTYGDAILNLATVEEQRGQADQAIRTLEEYLALRPQDARAVDTLARLYIVARKPRRTLALLTQLLQQAEVDGGIADRARLLNNMGVAHISLGELSAAAECFRQAMAAEWTTCVPHCNLAELLLRHGKSDEARAILAEALERYREDPRALQILAQYHVWKDDVVRAVDCLKRALELDPSDWLTYAWLGSILADGLQKHEEAVSVLRDGLRAVPESRILKNNLAYVLLMKGATADARQTLEGVEPLTLDERVYLTATRGLLAIREGKFEDGRRLYNEAARLATDPAIRHLARQKKLVELARAYAARGETTHALALLEEARHVVTPHKLFLHQAERLQQALGK